MFFAERHWQFLYVTWWPLLSHSLSWWWAVFFLQIWLLDVPYPSKVFEYSLNLFLYFHFFCLWCIFCIWSLLSGAVSLLWVCFFSTRWVFGFPRLPLISPQSLLLLQFRLLLHHFSFSFMSWPTWWCNTIEPASSSVRVHCSGSSLGHSVSITFLVCSPSVSFCLYCIVASQVSSFRMADIVLSSMSCSTCSTCLSCRFHVVPHFDFWELSISFFCFRHCISHFLLVLLHFHFLLVLLFFCFGVFFFEMTNSLFAAPAFSLSFSMISWYLFFELTLLVSNVFLGLIPSFMFCCIDLSFFCLAMATLFRRSDHESCHNTSLVTAHVDHVVGFSICVVFQKSCTCNVAQATKL